MFNAFKYITLAPMSVIGMLVFMAVMIGFIIWVTGFRTKTRELMKNKHYFLTASGIVLLICIGSLLFKGLNFGLDFTGGTVIQLAIDPKVEVSAIREGLKEFSATAQDPGRFQDPKIQLAVETEEGDTSKPQTPPVTPTPDVVSPSPAESPSADATPAVSPEATPAPEIKPAAKVNLPRFRKCMIQVKELKNEEIAALTKFLEAKIGPLEIMKSETVGPTIGKELKEKALLALLIALLAQLLYITFRFGTQLRYGIAADIALIHDLIIMVGLYSLLGKPVDSPFLAALLTIIGYSVMDTVVVFDRVRENLKLMKGSTYEETVNLSLNQVMTRTSATSFTTILTLFAIYYFGGDTLHNFALALLIGAVAGTYSSLFIASPLIIWFDGKVKAGEKSRVEARRARLEEEAKDKSAKKAEAVKAPARPEKETSEESEETDEEDDSGENEGEDGDKKSKKGARKRRR